MILKIENLSILAENVSENTIKKLKYVTRLVLKRIRIRDWVPHLIFWCIKVVPPGKVGRIQLEKSSVQILPMMCLSIYMLRIPFINKQYYSVILLKIFFNQWCARQLLIVYSHVCERKYIKKEL